MRGRFCPSWRLRLPPTRKNEMGEGLMSLRIRLFLLVVIAVLPALVIQIATQLDLRQVREKELHDEALRQAGTTASDLSEVFDGSRQLLFALSRLPAVQALDPASCSAVLGTMLGELSVYATVGAADLDGRLVCDATGLPASRSIRDRTFFRDAMQTNSFVIGEFMIGRTTGATVLPIAHPIYR